MRPFLFGVGFLKGVGSAPPPRFTVPAWMPVSSTGMREVDMYFPSLRSPYP
ncbi:hypothetical protein L611_001400000150 [Aminobacter sp. J15]|nr:hypothetical protein L611_001400000150 [Aminobacter sp. J15]